MNKSYYNENDPKAAAWLRELINKSLIAPGEVDERSIEDITPNEIKGYTQCHFFAGIGVWSYALRQSGWPDDRPVWTGSCPCQPFSAAGKGKGTTDERHLFPAWEWLIRECKPDVIFGEQVAGKAGLAWLDLVSAALEAGGYACGSAVTAACGFGAPHIRKRLYWVADSFGQRQNREHSLLWEENSRERREAEILEASRDCFIDSVANPDSQRPQGWEGVPERSNEFPSGTGSMEGNPGSVNGHWRDADWLSCRDGKWRPVEPGTFPLAHGAPSRVGLLRGYGNAIVAPQAQAFIESYLESINE